MIDLAASSSAIVVSALLLLSELLPFLTGLDANGILQGIVSGVSTFVAYRRVRSDDVSEKVKEPGETPSGKASRGGLADMV